MVYIAPQSIIVRWSGNSKTPFTRKIIQLKLIPNIVPTELVSYDGERNEMGEPHGRGISIDTDGDRWEGEFRNGYPDGKGVCEHTNGDRYEGYEVQGKRHGQGKYTWGSGPDKGAVYEGGWQDSLMHGYGIVYYPKENVDFYKRFEGNFQNGMRHGRGTWFYTDGNPMNFVSVEGDSIEGKMIDCNAKIIWKNPGRRYIGQVKKPDPNSGPLIDGAGTYISEDGTRVNGVFKYNPDTYRIDLIHATTPGDKERWYKMWGIGNAQTSPAPNPTQPNKSGGSAFWGALGAFAGGFLGSSGSSSSSSGRTYQCIQGHTMTSHFIPQRCSWCGNAMFPK